MMIGTYGLVMIALGMLMGSAGRPIALPELGRGFAAIQNFQKRAFSLAGLFRKCGVLSILQSN